MPIDMYERDVFELISGISSIHSDSHQAISGLCLNSKMIKHGDCFIAYPGITFDGRTFITQAIANGAAAVIQESNEEQDTLHYIQSASGRIPVIGIINLSAVVGHIASRFYNCPSAQMQVIGVTGTNGKTSICYFLSKALTSLHRKTGLISSIGIGHGDQLQSSQFTTPDAISLQSSMSDLLSKSSENVVMEVSSHGLSQGRVNGVMFDTAVWTNIKDHEHLDYHKTFEAYKQVKTSFFKMPEIKKMVINIDDPVGRELYQTYRHNKMVVGYQIGRPDKNYQQEMIVYATDVDCQLTGLTFCVYTPWGNGIVRTRVTGSYNVYNLMAVLSTMCLKGLPFSLVLKSLSKLGNPPGRMDVYGGKERKKPTVIVDYAHTPDALELVLKQLKIELKEGGRLICLFGCGGDRHTGKRKIMGKIASQYCHEVYITDDNPRSEEPVCIINDILEGIPKDSMFTVESDRAKAISMAISNATINDIILVAGKGHETKQVMNNYEIDMSDIQQVRLQLNCYS